MNNLNEKKQNDPPLRTVAEMHLAETPRVKPSERSVEALLHELQVHQIELEMQNDALRQAQIALEESRDRYVDLYEFAPVGYLTLTLDSLIEKINLTGTVLLGRERKKLLQKRFTSFVIPEDQDRWTRHFMSIKREGGQSSVELALERGNGMIFCVQIDCMRHEISAGHSTIRIVLSDITERKQVEAERALLNQILQDKNSELEKARVIEEKANLAKSDFLSSMSHELRTPLSAILGFAQLMESGKPLLTVVQKRNTDQILKAGWYLLELINEILDLAVIESGKISLSFESVSVAEVMHECEAIIEAQALKRGIMVVFTQTEVSYFINADRKRVKQILINLLSNAIKYNSVGGTVVVDCIASTTERIRICVKDTGEGLTEDNMTQLFQPFNRLGGANIEEGTGIGLVVCKRLVELMGGTIGVESKIGEGSVFWVEMDRANPSISLCTDAPMTTTQTLIHGNMQLHTLLYIEDNTANLMLVEDLIKRRPDIHLLSACNGKRGIELACASLPDLILMDINLPDMSGFTALKILAENPVTAHIPIMAVSANAMPQDIEKGLEAGFFRYITKPLKVNEFMETLDVAMKFAKTKL